MSALETIERARAFLERNRRVSLRVLKREFGLHDEALDELVAELVDVQQVAAREGKVLSWVGSSAKPAAGPRVDATTPESESPPEAERRQLTVLFCDLVESTRLAGGMDAEDWREVVRGYQEAATSVVERFEGHVAQYLGDGLLAYFGWPRAHEDDAERAVRAGLEIVAAVRKLDSRQGEPLASRVGIHTGPVVVGLIGGGSSRETLAVGDTTNIAARLEGTARPNTVVVSEATLRLSRGIASTADLGTPPLKGVSAPIRVHEIRALRGGRIRAERRFSSGPLVGRNGELALLHELWGRACGGSGQFVLLSGEAGIGKSRLAAALRDACERDSASWMQAQCVPFLANSALHPFVALLEEVLDLAADAAMEQRRAQLRERIAQWPWAGNEVLATVASLLSVPMEDDAFSSPRSPEREREETLAFLCQWILAQAVPSMPAALLIEDLHWADASSLEVSTRLLDHVATMPFLLLATSRPEFRPPWTTRAHLSQLTLGRLSVEQTRVVSTHLAGDELPAVVLTQLIERSEGVPLFAEELTRSALESESHTLPASLQDSLAARLDRMGECKRVAQLASILGRDFALDHLQAISDLPDTELQAHLENLVDADILCRRQKGSAPAFLFSHALIRDAAYESLLRSTRRQLHASVARTLASAFPAVAEQQPEQLADHFTRGGVHEEAAAWWLRAAQRALSRHAPAEATGHVAAGMAEVRNLPPASARDLRELELQMALGSALMATRGYGTLEVEACFSRARELCRRIGETPHLFPIMRGLYVNDLLKGNMGPAEEHARQLERLAVSEGDPGLRVEALFALGQVRLLQGAPAEGVERLEEAFRLYDRDRDKEHARIYGQDPGPFSLQLAAYGLWHLGRPDVASKQMTEAIALARAIGHPNTLGASLHFANLLHALRGEWNAVAKLSAEQIELSRAQSLPFWEASGRVFAGLARVEHGDSEGGLDEMSRGIDALAPTGAEMPRRMMMVDLVRAEAVAGNWPESLRHATETCATVEQHGHLLDRADLLRMRGEAFAHLSDAQGAEQYLRAALDLARERDQRSYGLRAAISLARLWQSQGRRAEACDVLQPEYDWFTEGFDTRDLKDAKVLLEELR